MKNQKKFLLLTVALLAMFFVPDFSLNLVFATDKVNINTADAVELDTIPEVGPSTATKIITYRETNGPFAKIEDIMNVSGIKQATFDKMKDFITVGDSDFPADGNSGNNGSGATTTATTTPDTTVATTTVAVTTSTGGGLGTISVHYYQDDLSNYVEPTDFEVSAGRERLAYLGLVINFQAKHKISRDLENRSCDYLWTFGDGASQAGEKAEHVYKYVGDYNVVLNGSCGGLHSVSRTMVRVTNHSLSMSGLTDGAVKISNGGKYEINLYGWKMQSSGSSYTFPLDTIISAGQSVIFPAGVFATATADGQIILADSSGKEVTRISSSSSSLHSEETISLAEFEKFALEYKRLTQTPALAVTPVSQQVALTVNQGKKEASVLQTASAVSAVFDTSNPDLSASSSSDLSPTDVPTRGFWSKLFHPIRTIQETFYK